MQDAHLLFVLPTTMTLSDAIRIFKSNSSGWLSPKFEWQQGYGAFGVSASNRDKVRNYIANQEKHHRKRTFEEEFLLFQKSAGIDYDTEIRVPLAAMPRLRRLDRFSFPTQRSRVGLGMLRLRRSLSL